MDIEKIKTFLASPEGAPAITGALRAILTLLIGFGVVITSTQAEQAVTTATTLIVLVNLVLSLVSVKAVQTRANQEEVDAAVSGKVLVDNNAIASPDA